MRTRFMLLVEPPIHPQFNLALIEKLVLIRLTPAPLYTLPHID